MKTATHATRAEVFVTTHAEVFGLVRECRFIVTAGGRVRVFDPVVGFFVFGYGISKETERRIWGMADFAAPRLG